MSLMVNVHFTAGEVVLSARQKAFAEVVNP
jgi:hypothetical protein